MGAGDTLHGRFDACISSFRVAERRVCCRVRRRGTTMRGNEQRRPKTVQGIRVGTQTKSARLFRFLRNVRDT